MKRLLLSVAAVCGLWSASVFGQGWKVTSIEKIQAPAGAIVDCVTISPDGNQAVLSDIAANDLKLHNLKSKTTRSIAGTQEAFDVQFSPDGQTIAFRQNSYDEHKLRYQKVVAVEVATDKSKVILPESRTISGFNIANANVVALDRQVKSAKSIKSTGSTTTISVGIDRGDLVVTVNGTTKVINPQGERSYIWPVLSPDQTRIAYWGDGVGCFVCNLDGSNPVSLGRLHAPQWLDDNTVIGMDDYDDGKVITESSIVVVAADGSYGQRLTTDGIIAIYPSASADGSKVAFTNPKGEAFIMTLTR